MKMLFLTLIIILTFFSCGKKDDPEYKSFNYKTNIVKRI